ncbi:MAG: heme-binding protein [Fuerstiella sp.]
MREFYKNLRRICNTLTCSIRTIHIVTSDTLVVCDVLGTMFNVEHSIGELITFPGGIPLKSFDGTVIGFARVSGSTVEIDDKTATCAQDAT